MHSDVMKSYLNKWLYCTFMHTNANVKKMSFYKQAWNWSRNMTNVLFIVCLLISGKHLHLIYFFIYFVPMITSHRSTRGHVECWDQMNGLRQSITDASKNQSRSSWWVGEAGDSGLNCSKESPPLHPCLRPLPDQLYLVCTGPAYCTALIYGSA